MENIKQLEKQIEVWLKPVPHLPKSWCQWLTDNIWWLVAIGVVLSIFGILGLAGAVFIASSYIGTAEIMGYGAYSSASGFGSWWSIVSLASLVAMVIEVVLLARSVSPLRELKRKGWELLFLTAVVSVASSALVNILTFSVFNLIGTAFGAAINAYFLFEIRSGFNSINLVRKHK